MKITFLQKFLFLILLLGIHAMVIAQNFPIKLEIDSFRTLNGSVEVKIFENQEGFDKDIAVMHKVFNKQQCLDKGVFKAELLLPPGTYGLAIFDDENQDGEMNYNLVGMPKEGFGFSNYYHTGLTRPRFSEFSFTHNKSGKVLKIKIKYM